MGTPEVVAREITSSVERLPVDRAMGRKWGGYRSYSKLRTHTALGPYARSVPRSIGPAYGVVRVLNFE